MIDSSAGNPSPERDAVVLHALSGCHSIGGRELFSLQERRESLHRTAQSWPPSPSQLLRLAAVAHNLDEGLEERFASVPDSLAAFAERTPWSVEPDEADTLRLAAMTCLERIDYPSFDPSYGTPMVLRDALSSPEDLSTISAMVRWDSLVRIEVSTPDGLLLRWQKEVSSLASRGHAGCDSSEYINTLEIRGHLQRFAAVLSWAGQDEWREHIEPVDDSFRDCTERQEVPLAFCGDAQPGAWWWYRLPVWAAELPGWSVGPPKPDNYVAGGSSFGLRTISHVWDLAERPHGIAAMTDQELDRWAALCAFQAGAIGKKGQGGWWETNHAHVLAEQRRRAATRPSSG